jgi:acyl transferase domain-containing protein
VLEAAPRISRPKSTNNQKLNSVAMGVSNGLVPLKSAEVGISSYKIRYLYILSANSEKSLKSQMQNLGIYLEQRPEILELSLMGKVAYTLCQRRSILTWKIAVSAKTSSELVQKLSNPDLRPVSSFYEPKISFVFTGQGAQWNEMGRELMKAYPVFLKALEDADKCLKGLGASWSLIGKNRY